MEGKRIAKCILSRRLILPLARNAHFAQNRSMRKTNPYRHFSDPEACLLNPLHPDSILAVMLIVLVAVVLHVAS